jgi:hypothetical protein
MRNAHKILSGNVKGRYHLEAIVCRWKSNIEENAEDIGWDGVD